MKKIFVLFLSLFLVACSMSNESNVDDLQSYLNDQQFDIALKELESEKEQQSWLEYIGLYYAHRIADRSPDDFKTVITKNGYHISKSKTYNDNHDFITDLQNNEQATLLSNQEIDFLNTVLDLDYLDESQREVYVERIEQALNYQQLYVAYEGIKKFIITNQDNDMLDPQRYDFYERDQKDNLLNTIKNFDDIMDDYQHALEGYVDYNEEGTALELDFEAQKDFYILCKNILETQAQNFNNSMKAFNNGER